MISSASESKKEFDWSEYKKRAQGMSLRYICEYEENISLSGEIFCTKRPALLLAQELINEATESPQRKILLWESFFFWAKKRQVRFT